MTAILSGAFEGAEALRDQWAHALVEPSCECGCGSIGFVFEGGFTPTPSVAPSPLPYEAEILDAGGAVVGGAIILLRDGLLDDVDVHAYGAAPLPFPSRSMLRLVARRRSG